MRHAAASVLRIVAACTATCGARRMRHAAIVARLARSPTRQPALEARRRVQRVASGTPRARASRQRVRRCVCRGRHRRTRTSAPAADAMSSDISQHRQPHAPAARQQQTQQHCQQHCPRAAADLCKEELSYVCTLLVERGHSHPPAPQSCGRRAGIAGLQVAVGRHARPLRHPRCMPARASAWRGAHHAGARRGAHGAPALSSRRSSAVGSSRAASCLLCR
jgi:hypothetical protein